MSSLPPSESTHAKQLKTLPPRGVSSRRLKALTQTAAELFPFPENQHLARYLQQSGMDRRSSDPTHQASPGARSYRGFHGFSLTPALHSDAARSTVYRSVLTACAGDCAVAWTRDGPEGSTVGVGVSSARRAACVAFNSPILLVCRPRPSRICFLPTALRASGGQLTCYSICGCTRDLPPTGDLYTDDA
jgi:hypothetical protein